ncbi:MAG: glycosyltransferase [Candidatus Omnitrophota bacterium]
MLEQMNILKKLAKYSIDFFKKSKNPLPSLRNDSICAVSGRVDIIVYVNTGLSLFKECLESVVKNSTDYHLIIVNDSLDKEVKDYLVAFSSQHNCTWIENLDTLGYAKSINKAISACACAYIVLLDADVILTKTWLENMLECINTDDTIGIVTPLLDTELYQGLNSIFQPDDKKVNALLESFNLEMMATIVENASCNDFPKISFMNQPCFMIKKDVIGSIGLLKEKGSSEKQEVMKDYWLRAQEAGFNTRIADNCYVSHKRFDWFNGKLNELSTGNIHDSNLHKIFNSVKQLLLSTTLIKELFNKSILFLMPSMGGSGGVHSVIQEVSGLRECGLNVKVAIFKSNIDSFLFHYPEAKDFCCVYANENDEELIKQSGKFDIVISTNHTSVKCLEKIVDNHPEVIPLRYIQDYEPWFFKKNDLRHSAAEQSHTLVPNMVCFAKTDWLCKIIKQFHGVDVVKINPSLDKSIYNYWGVRNKKITEPVRITAMIRVRHSSPRRSPKETLTILKIIKKKYKNRVDIRVFGSSDEELDTMDESRGFRFINFGELKRLQVAELLKSSDIFVDASQYQAFGRTGLEAMAVGCATILPKNCGTSEYAKDNENSLLVDTKEKSKVILAIERLISDKELLAHIKEEGIKTARLYSVRKAVWSEILLFSHILTRENK